MIIYQTANRQSSKFARIRRVIIAVIGFTVLLIGVAMLVLPGPAIVVIPLALGILATEFVWARRLLQRARAAFAKKERQTGTESPDRLKQEPGVKQSSHS